MNDPLAGARNKMQKPMVNCCLKDLSDVSIISDHDGLPFGQKEIYPLHRNMEFKER